MGLDNELVGEETECAMCGCVFRSTEDYEAHIELVRVGRHIQDERCMPIWKMLRDWDVNRRFAFIAPQGGLDA